MTEESTTQPGHQCIPGTVRIEHLSVSVQAFRTELCLAGIFLLPVVEGQTFKRWALVIACREATEGA